MAFIQISGRRVVEYRSKKASTAFSVGSLVNSANGEIQPATSTSTKHVGVCLKKIASTDSDYASETMIPVSIAHSDAIFEADATSLNSELEGTTMDLTDDLTVNGAADSHHAVTLVKFISATKGWFKINSLDTYVAGA